MTIRAASKTVEEGDRTRFTIKRTGDLSKSLVVAYELGGTAGKNDYSLKPSIKFKAGDHETIVEIKTQDDKRVERDETVTMRLLPTDDYSLGSADRATTTIVDNDPAIPTVHVRVSKKEIDESGRAVFTFVRDGDLSEPLEVHVNLKGTAKLKKDFQVPKGKIIIPAGKDRVAIEVKAKDDAVNERDETVVVQLRASKEYKIAKQGGSAKLTIIDNDDPGQQIKGIVKWVSELVEKFKRDDDRDDDDDDRGLFSWLRRDRDDDRDDDDDDDD